MPTYTYNGTRDNNFIDPSGKIITVSPGGSFESYEFLTDSDVTKTADTPLYSRSTATTSVTLAASAADHDLNADTRFFIVTQITGEVTVRPQVDTAVPILLGHTSSDPVVQFSRKDYPCSKLRVSGTGTCTIMEFRA